MNPLIEAKKDELFALCRLYGVKTLELFGSATGDRFDPETSDLDFLVEYRDDAPPGGLFKGHFGLKFAMEDLFGRPVDLVMPRAIRNPYFLQEIRRDRVVLYAA